MAIACPISVVRRSRCWQRVEKNKPSKAVWGTPKNTDSADIFGAVINSVILRRYVPYDMMTQKHYVSKLQGDLPCGEKSV